MKRRYYDAIFFYKENSGIMILLLACLILFVFSIKQSRGFLARNYVAVFQSPEKNDFRNFDLNLRDLGYDTLGYDPEKRTFKVLVNVEELNMLASEFHLESVVDRYSVSVPEGYRSFEEIYKILDDTHDQYPDLTEIFDASKEYGPGSTYENRPIKVIRVSGTGNPKEKPNLLVDGGHHAREIVGVESVVELLEYLVTEYGKDHVVTSILDRYNVFLLPILNVDGYNYVFTQDPNWRKNRKPNAGGSFGVDLNRNYDIGWLECGGSSTPTSSSFRGEDPFSEEETQTIRGMIEEFNFAKVVTFHSYGQEVLYYYTSCLKMPDPYRQMIVDLAQIVATPAGYRTRAPSADAEHMEYQFARSTAFAWLVETSKTFQPSYADAQAEIKERIIPLLINVLSSSLPVSGKVVDGETKEPLRARIHRPGYTWHNGETRESGKNGVYHLYVPLGSNRVEFEAEGYKHHHEYFDYDGNPIEKDIELEKL